MIFLTCHHQRTHTFHAALHGGFHEGGEAVTVPPLDVQPGVVVEQVVGDGYVALKNKGTYSSYDKRPGITMLAEMRAADSHLSYCAHSTSV